MSWVSLVCLLALSSSALARSMYGSGYGSSSASLINPLPVTASFGAQKSFLMPKTNLGVALTSRVESLPVSKPFESYGAQPSSQFETISLPKPIENFATIPTASRIIPSFGAASRVIPSFGTTPRVFPSFGATPAAPRLVSGYGQSVPQMDILPLSKSVEGYGAATTDSRLSGYGSQAMSSPLGFNEPIAKVRKEADIACQGKVAETVILIDGGRRYIICSNDGEGEEMSCQKGLYYSQELRRCDYKPGSMPDPCISQPCLNGGQCTSNGYTFECTCASGYDGRVCELDARVCQTQQPCGQSSDTRCQSFRFGAALTHVCIFQGGFAYGLSAGQTQPNPCSSVDGTQSLAFSNKGFIMCDGDRMSIESCPGGTIWDDINKACSWPDMEGLPVPSPIEQRPTGYSHGYGAELQKHVFDSPKPVMETQRPAWDAQRPVFETPRPILETQRPVFETQRPVFETQRPVFETQRPVFETQRPVFETQRPAWETQRPILETQRPAWETQRPILETQRPVFETQRPAWETPRPIFETQRPMFETSKPIFEAPKLKMQAPSLIQSQSGY